MKQHTASGHRMYKSYVEATTVSYSRVGVGGTNARSRAVKAARFRGALACFYDWAWRR